MARKIHISKEELLQAKHLRDNARTITDFRKALSVILAVELGLDADQASDILGISRRTIFRHRGDIRNKDDTPKRSWGGRRRCSMSIEEERAFLSPWEVKAAAGGVLSVPPIHAALVQRLGHDTPMSTTYRLLARHGWRKVQPDTKHPKSDPAQQEEFKKNCPKWWPPPTRKM
jgi:transposase